MATTLLSGKPCPSCGVVQVFRVPEHAVRYWRAGGFIQDAFPMLSDDQREALLTGYCPPCWDADMGEEE